MKQPRLYLDTECYIDYYLLMVMDDEGRSAAVEAYPGLPFDTETARRLLGVEGAEYVTFNGINYDMVTMRHALAGASCSELKALSDAIIVGGLKPWEAERRYSMADLSFNHVDLIEVAPGRNSLKMYGARMHCPKLQELPLPPESSIHENLRPLMRRYCKNDLWTTRALRLKLDSEINLRVIMNAELRASLGREGNRLLRLDDMRSKSDAQIAEVVLKARVFNATGAIPRKLDGVAKDFKYVAPDYITFTTDNLKQALSTITSEVIKVNQETGHVHMPDSIAKLALTIGTTTYKMGVGGLHSQESEVSHYADENTYLRDIDVRSYYPNLMLNMGMYPTAMGPHFLKAYRDILNERLAAKDSGDKTKDSVLKITLNGCFGKTSNKYSILYNPSMTIHTTLTGQLSILMLIEALEANGVPVVSANTDGIVVKPQRGREAMQRSIVKEWEHVVNLETEETDYSSIHSRDVNSYIAIKTNGSVKTKGAFAKAGLAKNPQSEICVTAVVRYLQDKTPVDDTIRECTDLTQFLSVRRVTGGAEKDGEPVGKVVRWYYANSVTGVMRYHTGKKQGDIVGRTSGAKPVADLPAAFPDDVNYDWYITEAEELLADIDVAPRLAKVPLPRRGTKEWKRLDGLGLVGVDDYDKPTWLVHRSDIPAEYLDRAN